MTLRTQVIKKVAKPLGVTTGVIAKQLGMTFGMFKKMAKEENEDLIFRIQKNFDIVLKKTS
jgi:hypothetical protein